MYMVSGWQFADFDIEFDEIGDPEESFQRYAIILKMFIVFVTCKTYHIPLTDRSDFSLRITNHESLTSALWLFNICYQKAGDTAFLLDEYSK